MIFLGVFISTQNLSKAKQEPIAKGFPVVNCVRWKFKFLLISAGSSYSPQKDKVPAKLQLSHQPLRSETPEKLPMKFHLPRQIPLWLLFIYLTPQRVAIKAKKVFPLNMKSRVSVNLRLFLFSSGWVKSKAYSNLNEISWKRWVLLLRQSANFIFIVLPSCETTPKGARVNDCKLLFWFILMGLASGRVHSANTEIEFLAKAAIFSMPVVGMVYWDCAIY